MSPPDGDVAGFYGALGIELPGWATRYASVRCFAAPDEHTNGDRTPSTSINLTTGSWRCFGCGARGSPYSAALERGHTRQAAFDLLVAYGLAEPGRAARYGQHPARPTGRTIRRRSAPPPAELEAHEDDIARWQRKLAGADALVARLDRERAWSYQAMVDLQVGLDPMGRLTIPIRNAQGKLIGVLRYNPWRARKMFTVKGTRLGLIPHPTRERGPDVLLVEGPSDAIAARSFGVPAIAVPGDHAWRAQWSRELAGRTVTVIMDSDKAGRDAARRIARDLRAHADVRVVDLAPGRTDGYDLTDALLNYRRRVNEPPSRRPPPRRLPPAPTRAGTPGAHPAGPNQD